MSRRVNCISYLVLAMSCYSACFGWKHLIYEAYGCDESSIPDFDGIKPLRLVETASVTSRVSCVRLCEENRPVSPPLLALVYQSSANITMTCRLLTTMTTSFEEYQIGDDLQDHGLTPFCSLYFPQGHTCETLQGEGQKVTWINLWSNHPGVPAVCDLSLDGGGWTVIQRRQDGSEDFYRGWQDYKTGFGSLEGEFWFGLEKIRTIVDSKPHEIRFDMESSSGVRKYAVYQDFWFDVESNDYRMSVGSYSGNAGDSFSFHNKAKFDTFDNMPRSSSPLCPERFKSGFWYTDCHRTNPNGVYGSTGFGQGIIWSAFLGLSESLVFIEMKVRPMS